jgi:hypothetical protein
LPKRAKGIAHCGAASVGASTESPEAVVNTGARKPSATKPSHSLELLQQQHRELCELEVCLTALNGLELACSSEYLKPAVRARLVAALCVDAPNRIDDALRSGERWLAGPPVVLRRPDGSDALCTSACAATSVLLQGVGYCLAITVTSDNAACKALLGEASLLSEKLDEKWTAEGVPQTLKDDLLPWVAWLFGLVRTELSTATARCTAEYRQTVGADSARKYPAPPEEPLTEPQKAILHALDGKALGVEALARECGVEPGTLYRQGLKTVLERRGRVTKLPGLGWYRPDRPPK